MKALLILFTMAWMPGMVPVGYEPLGVCSLAVDAPACWSPDGLVKPELLAKVRQGVASMRFSRQDEPEGVRYVALHAIAGEGAVFHAEHALDTPVFTHYDETGSSVLLRVLPLNHATSFRLTGRVSVRIEPGREVRFRPGRKADVDGDTVEIGPVRSLAPAPAIAAHPEEYPPDQRGRLWQTIIGHSAEGGPDLGLRFLPLGRDGKPIRYVDRKGRPVPEEVGRAAYGKTVDPQNGILPALFWPQSAGYGSSEAFRCDTNIDPKFLDRLRVIRVVTRDEDYGQLALEPKRP